MEFCGEPKNRMECDHRGDDGAGGRRHVGAPVVLKPRRREEEITCRFQVVIFHEGERWALGKPTLLLPTKDGGRSWERVPLSPELPGEPAVAFAFAYLMRHACQQDGLFSPLSMKRLQRRGVLVFEYEATSYSWVVMGILLAFACAATHSSVRRHVPPL